MSKALCLTVDSACIGKRERDLRNKIAMELGRVRPPPLEHAPFDGRARLRALTQHSIRTATELTCVTTPVTAMLCYAMPSIKRPAFGRAQLKQQQAAAKGTAVRKAGQFASRDPALNWRDVAWFQEQTDIPIVLKGVQTGEDAVSALRAGAAAVLLSNHGGRNCDTARSGIEVRAASRSRLRATLSSTHPSAHLRSHLSSRHSSQVLEEAVAALEATGEWFAADGTRRMEVWVDGGVRRGTDIFKALALGADAVGIGKPAVYAMSAFGQEGVARAVGILHEELTATMRLCGAPSIGAIQRSMVDTTMLHQRPVYDVPLADVTGAPATGGGAPAAPTVPASGGATETRGDAIGPGALGRRSAWELLQLLHLVLCELTARGADAIGTAISTMGDEKILCSLLLVWTFAFASVGI